MVSSLSLVIRNLRLIAIRTDLCLQVWQVDLWVLNNSKRRNWCNTAVTVCAHLTNRKTGEERCNANRISPIKRMFSARLVAAFSERVQCVLRNKSGRSKLASCWECGKHVSHGTPQFGKQSSTHESLTFEWVLKKTNESLKTCFAVPFCSRVRPNSNSLVWLTPP